MQANRTLWALLLAAGLLVAGCDNKHDGSMAGDTDAAADNVADASPVARPPAPPVAPVQTAHAPTATLATPAPAPLPAANDPSTAAAAAEPEYRAALDPGIPVDQRVAMFLQQSEEEQTDTIIAMEGNKSDIEMIGQLLPQKLSSDLKQSMLDILEDADKSDAMPALKVALDDSNTEVATKAIDVLVFLGDQSDVGTLKALAEKTDNEEVKKAAEDAVEMLE